MCTTAYIIALYVTLLAREASSLAALDQLGSLQLCRASAASEEASWGGAKVSKEALMKALVHIGRHVSVHMEGCMCMHGAYVCIHNVPPTPHSP